MSTLTKAILYIIPDLDAGALNKMERTLSSKFTRIARKFGSGLKNSVVNMIGGGLKGIAMGLGMGLFEKMVNPLKEAEEAINGLLDQSDDIVTNATQFETTAGKMFKLQQLAASTGVDDDTLRMMLSKFQVSMAEARTGGDQTLAQFTDDKDLIDAFYKFQLSMREMPKDMQVLFQSKIFGERLVGRAYEFFQTDLAAREKEVGARESEFYNRPISKAGGLEDLRGINTARRNLQYLPENMDKINKEMLRNMDLGERKKLIAQGKDIEGYNDIKIAANAIAEINEKIKGLANQVFTLLPRIVELLEKVAGSRVVKGLGGLLGGSK